MKQFVMSVERQLLFTDAAYYSEHAVAFHHSV